jgi:hypothetical protein
VGFGYERLNSIVNNKPIENDIEVLIMTINKCIECGIKPSPKEQGYVLRKLLRELRKRGGYLDHEFFQRELDRYQKSLERYQKLKDKFPDKPKEWWYDTHGIDLDEM